MNEDDKPLDPEIAEIARRYMIRLFGFETRESEDCQNCGNHVGQLEQVGRCVYARPCGCRIWQGTVPEAWRE